METGYKSEQQPPGAGHSSFELIDPDRLFSELPLQGGITFLDLGCGEGRYTQAVAARLGTDAIIYAVDLWEEGINRLKERLATAPQGQIKAMVADVTNLPLDDAGIDLCLMATVLHDLVEYHTAAGALSEVARVLKPGGMLAIVEFEKVEGPPGPPLRIRLNPEEVEDLVGPYGFTRQKHMGVGPYNYLLTFRKAAARR